MHEAYIVENRKNIFNERLYKIEGEDIELQLIDTFEEKDGALPFYWWNIVLKPEGKTIGKISFRIGYNYHIYFNGNIGYEIDEPYRGNHYSLLACQLVLQCAKFYGMKKIYLTCDYDNIASYKTIEKLGANLIEEKVPPKDYIFYYDGIPKHKIYELLIQ